jgi:hypothetical protein
MHQLMRLDVILLLAGVLHFALLPVSFSVPVVLDWKHQLAALSPFNRRIVWVHGAFIVLTIIGFGILTLVGRHAMAAGESTARALAVFIGLFWLARLLVQLFYYDPADWPKGTWAVVGRHATSLLFAGWATVYLVAGLR